jgi:hypothetical protein
MNAISNPPFKRRLMMAAAACGLLALSTASVMAQDDDEPTFEQQIFQKLLGRNKPAIDYRERSPLVIPPSAELPAPDSATASAAPNGAAWPQDADLKQKKSGRSVRGADESDRAASALLTPDEIRRGKIARSERKRSVTLSDNESSRVLRPDEIGGKQYSLFQLFGKSMTTEKPEAFTTDPVRETLTEPPPGYRTPSPAQPYQPPKNEPIFKMPSLWDRGTGDPN